MSALQPFKAIFPSKKLVNKILFQLDSPVTSRKLLPLYESIYNTGRLPPGPAKDLNSNTLFVMYKVLERARKTTQFEYPEVRKIREYCLTESAVRGSNDAIALLCQQIMLTPEGSEAVSMEKKQRASRLLKELVSIGHPLSFKVVGDLMSAKRWGTSGGNRAEDWYLKYLECDEYAIGNELRGEVLEKLGEIEMKKQDLSERDLKLAESRFLEAIRITNPKERARSFYYLAQIYIRYDPLKSEILLEQACSQGLKEGFKEIGHLEKNYFKNVEKAREWFRIGMELFDIECFFGYFDCCYALKDYKNAYNTLESLKGMVKRDEGYRETVKAFVAYRLDKISTLSDKVSEIAVVGRSEKQLDTENKTPKNMATKNEDSRWDF